MAVAKKKKKKFKYLLITGEFDDLHYCHNFADVNKAMEGVDRFDHVAAGPKVGKQEIDLIGSEDTATTGLVLEVAEDGNIRPVCLTSEQRTTFDRAYDGK